MNIEITTTIIPSYECPGTLSGWSVSEQVFQTADFRRYKIGYVGPDGYGRRVNQGPIVPGPWATVIELPIVIDNTGQAAEQNKALKESGLLINVAPGDTIEIDDFQFTIDYSRVYGMTLSEAS